MLFTQNLQPIVGFCLYQIRKKNLIYNSPLPSVNHCAIELSTAGAGKAETIKYSKKGGAHREGLENQTSNMYKFVNVTIRFRIGNKISRACLWNCLPKTMNDPFLLSGELYVQANYTRIVLVGCARWPRGYLLTSPVAQFPSERPPPGNQVHPSLICAHSETVTGWKRYA